MSKFSFLASKQDLYSICLEVEKKYSNRDNDMYWYIRQAFECICRYYNIEANTYQEKLIKLHDITNFENNIFLDFKKTIIACNLRVHILEHSIEEQNKINNNLKRYFDKNYAVFEKLCRALYYHPNYKSSGRNNRVNNKKQSRLESNYTDPVPQILIRRQKAGQTSRTSCSNNDPLVLAKQYLDQDKPEKAAKVLLNAAQNRNPDAAYAYALFCLYGDGVAADYNLALDWFNYAADLGSEDAVKALQDLNSQQNSYPEDNYTSSSQTTKATPALSEGEQFYQTAMSYYDAGDYYNAAINMAEAAQRDHPRACYLYGFMLEYGQGLDVNPELAYGWYQRAWSLGAREAYDSVNRLGPRYYKNSSYNPLYDNSHNQNSKNILVCILGILVALVLLYYFITSFWLYLLILFIIIGIFK